MRRIFKLIVVTLVICLVSVPLLSCASKTSSAAVSQSQVTVQRGNLVIDILATGNLALSQKEDLAFEMAGTVEEVLVQAGDSVEKGQVLAKLDTSVWEEQLKALEDKVTAAETNLTNAQSSAVGKKLDKELAVLQAQLDLQTAQDNLYKIAQVKAAKDAVDAAQHNFDLALAIAEATGIAMGSGSSNRWDAQVLNQELARAKNYLDEILNGSKLPDDVALQVAISQKQVERKQRSLEAAQIAVEEVQTTIEDAQKVVDDDQKALDDAKNTSPEVKAPFDGFITTVSVKGGDEIKKGKIAVTLADPTKFETEVLVSEMDIFQVKLGGNATVQVNAMPTINLSANVTRISPTATIQSGVVNYKVKVEIKSPEAVMQELQAARQAATENITQTSGTRVPTTQGQRPSLTSGTQALTTLTSQIAQLKEGLTVTVTMVVAEKNNVLLVSNRAISQSGRETVVKVLKDGVIESRSIKTGLSDGLNTEVTEGLSEGENVVITKTTTTTTTTSTQGQGQFFIPGMGGR